MKPFKCHNFNTPLAVTDLAKISHVWFFWSIILCSTCTDKLQAAATVATFPNLYMFVTSKCFLVPNTTTFSM